MDKSSDQFSFIKSGQSMRVLEIPADDLERCDFDEVIREVFCKGHIGRNVHATIYTYFEMGSCNFGSPMCDSFFFGVCGSPQFAEQLILVAINILNIRVHESSYLPLDGITRRYHIQDGEAWIYADAYTYTLMDMDVDAAQLENEPGEVEEMELGESTQQKNTMVARRTYVARSDSSIGTLIQRINEVFGLPEGSVKIFKPDGARLRADSTVGRLRELWDK